MKPTVSARRQYRQKIFWAVLTVLLRRWRWPVFRWPSVPVYPILIWIRSGKTMILFVGIVTIVVRQSRRLLVGESISTRLSTGICSERRLLMGDPLRRMRRWPQIHLIWPWIKKMTCTRRGVWRFCDTLLVRFPQSAVYGRITHGNWLIVTRKWKSRS